MIFLLKRMVDRVLLVVGALGSLSASFSCPAHCGGSSVSSFLGGLGLGLFLGLISASLIFLWIWGNIHSSHPYPVASPPLSPVLRGPASRRLRGYVHE